VPSARAAAAEFLGSLPIFSAASDCAVRDLVTAAGMRAAETAAIESAEVTGFELMERAGRGVVAAILERRDAFARAPHRAAILCGPGNNGGDGFVVARLLHERGWSVVVLLFGRDPGEIDRLPPDAAENARRWRALGPIRALDAAACERLPADIWVDALFGTGASRPLPGEITACFAAIAARRETERVPVIAVDAPSGLCLDSGRLIGGGPGLEADATVTFAPAKIGHYLAEGPRLCGQLCAVDIGLDTAPVPTGESVALTGPEVAAAAAKIGRHKYDHGHTLVLSGGVGKGGAARLAARAALRLGAGLVTVGCPPAALIENAAQLTAVMLRPVGDAAALAEALEDRRLNALCLGPGMGLGEPTREMVAAACRAGRATVLDADALTSFSADPGALFALTHAACVLTPHAGEFRRIFPDLRDRLEWAPETGPAYSKLDATRAAAARAGCIVLFKGADTVIAAPDGRAAICAAHYERAAPWLATAGAGDVLSGMIAGLLARGLAPMVAAEAAAWLHGEAARGFGPGLIAEDLPERLPTVLGDQGL